MEIFILIVLLLVVYLTVMGAIRERDRIIKSLEKGMRIIVWLNSDYTEASEFVCPEWWTRQMIIDEINRRHSDWFSFDID